ncbi:MAG: hypothetical protein ACJ8AJ_09695 [Gemmatimonadaceae bacterium]
MRAAKLISGVGSSALLLCVLASSAAGQERSRRAPSIRIYSQSGGDVIGTSSYVEPAIDVSENAYAFAVAIDLDGQIRVLHPDFPGLSVRLVAHRQLQLPNFFAGFGQATSGRGVYSSAAYSSYQYGRLDSRGTVIALASREPFDLERIEVDGDWNISEIRRLVENRSPELAAQALAAYLGQKGEPIGRDFMRFAGGQSYYAYNNYYSPCDLYAYGFASSYAFRTLKSARLSTLSQSKGARIIGYDLCGFPIIVFQNGVRTPSTRPPVTGGGPTAVPKGRIAQEHGPRRPPSAASTEPLEGRSRLPQMGDVTIIAPSRRRSEPSSVIDGFRSQPASIGVPIGRMPVERTIPERSQPMTTGSSGATGAPPVHTYHPEPRVVAPPPSRVPDTPRETSPPPSRTKPEPTPTPPPKQ